MVLVVRLHAGLRVMTWGFAGRCRCVFISHGGLLSGVMVSCNHHTRESLCLRIYICFIQDVRHGQLR